MQNFYQESEPIISGDNIHKTYLFGLEGVAALRGVSVHVKQGEFIIILGNSGGGKTSLLNVLGTIDRQTKGTLSLYGEKIKSTTKDEILSGLRLNYIGFVFQTFNLIGSLNAKQNVQLPMILKGDLTPSQISKRAEQLLHSVQMSHRLKHFPSQLSGGEQQRVTIARALANNPKVLLLDEPTGDLDSKNGRIVLDILIRLNIEQKITLLMVTHDVNLKTYSHRVLKVLDGKIIGEETIDPTLREQQILKLRQALKQDKTEGSSQCIQFDQTVNRKPDSYPAVKWLKEKRLRQKLQEQINERIRIELERENSIMDKK